MSGQEEGLAVLVEEVWAEVLEPQISQLMQLLGARAVGWLVAREYGRVTVLRHWNVGAFANDRRRLLELLHPCAFRARRIVQVLEVLRGVEVEHISYCLD